MIPQILYIPLLFTVSVTGITVSKREQPNYNWQGLYVSYHPNGKLSYMQMPWSKNEARRMAGGEWKEINEGRRRDNLRYFCPSNDKTVCTIFDDEELVGVQIAIPATHSTFIKLKLGQTPFVKATLGTQQYWKIDLFFTNPASLKTTSMLGGSSLSRQSGVGNLVTQKHLGGAFYVDSKQIPNNANDISKLGFTAQRCIQGRGTNYAYGINLQQFTCDKLYPIVPMYQKGSLMGFNFLIPGTYSSDKKWFVVYDEKDIKEMFPKGAPCLAQWAKQYKFSNIHFEFRTSPISDC